MQLHDAAGKRFYLTPDERAAFVAAANRVERPVRTLCLVLHTTGCRISEALALTPAQIDIEGKRHRLRKPQEAPQGGLQGRSRPPCPAGHAQLETTAIYANALGAEEQGIAARMW